MSNHPETRLTAPNPAFGTIPHGMSANLLQTHHKMRSIAAPAVVRPPLQNQFCLYVEKRGAGSSSKNCKRLARRKDRRSRHCWGRGSRRRWGKHRLRGCPVLPPKLGKCAGFALKILKELKDARVLGFSEAAYLLGCAGGLVGDITKRRWVI